MKHFLLKILLFVFMFFVIIISIGKLDNIIIPNDVNVIKLKTLNKFDSLEYLIVGNSYTYSTINISYFDSINVKAFNLGIATAGVNFYDVVIDDYLKVNNKPKTILLLVTSMTFCSESDNWKSYPIHRYLNMPLSNEEVFINYDRNVTNYFSLLKKSFKKGVVWLKSTNSQQKYNLKHKGFVESQDVYNQKIFKETEKYYIPLKENIFNNQRVEKMIMLAKSYKKQGINVVFYETPTFKLNTFFNKAYLNDYKKAIKKIEKNNFIFIKNTLKLDSTYFRNIDHCNSKGANIYTKYLIQKLGNE